MMTEGRAAAASFSRINLGETAKRVMTEDRGFLSALLLHVRGKRKSGRGRVPVSGGVT